MSQVSHPIQDKVPTEVGPYVIRSKLGSGGMGEVYCAWDTRLERSVAVKKVLAKDALREKSRQRLKNEARAIASLSHPAIVRIFDLLETDDSDWIVMELVEGRTLRSLIRTRTIVETEALALAREITEGLSAAHAKGLVHRDLKLDNVMVTHLGHVKILDFGLAEPYEEEDGSCAPDGDDASASLTTRSRVVGTSSAMSPEQAKGLSLDPRSDLFSLGSLIYEMVTTESPFQGPSTYATMTRVCYHRQPPAHEIRPDISPELSNLIDHLLEKDPARRPQSAMDTSAVLDSLAGIAPLPPSLGYLLWPTESAVIDASVLSDTTAGVPRFLPKSLLSSEELRHSIFIWTMLATELTCGADILRRFGDERAAHILLKVDRCVRDLLPAYTGFEIDKGEGFLLLFRRPTDAVRYALAFRRRLVTLAEELAAEDLDMDLTARIGIHVGEVHLRENIAADVERGAKRFEAEGHTKVIAARVMQHARPGQILVTQGVYELARLARVDVEEPEERVVWRKHSAQQMPGIDEMIGIFEVAVAQPDDDDGASAPTRRPWPSWWRWAAAVAALGLAAWLWVLL